ncbi:MAG: cytochrome P450 [Actinobacteria bacterium]|nr:cytochrome P450 [Actinomycetota bacterium]
MQPTTEPDPFEEFNRAMGAGRIQDPYPNLAERRREAPVSPADIRALMGLAADADLGDFGDMPPVFTAYSFEAVQQCLRDGETFSSSGYAPVMGEVFGHSILEMDEPEHHHYRSLIQQAFSRKAMERWESDVVGPVVDAHIDEFVDEGRADLVRQLTFPFPVTVIGHMLGLPYDDLAQFHRWAVELISVSIDYEKAVRASKLLYDYFKGIIDERRVAPAEDLISVLALAELHEGGERHRLNDDEIIAFLRLLLPAGAETTYRSSSNLLTGLLTHPDQLDAVRADRSLLPQAIEEALRWEAPLLLIQRLATRDTELCGVAIPEGAVVAVAVGSANHDETRWDRPDEFDIFREPQQHLAFAFGPHMCLGMHLARMETTVVMNRVFDRLPEVRVDPDAPPPHITGMTFRSPPTLPVVWG